MILHDDTYNKIAELIFKLRQKCALKDAYFMKLFGISQSEYNCLVQFFEVNSMGVKDLAERLEITPGGVTRIITSLENKGYVERRISLDDRRNINVLLTSQGKKLVKKMRRAAIDIHREIFDQIDPSERETVAAAIQTLLNALDSWLQEQARVLEES